MVKLCGYENEHLINIKEEDKNERVKILIEEIKKQKELIFVKSDVKRNLTHLKASTEELHSLLKNN